MAEFCLQCRNELNNTCDPPEKYIISKELELCEGCGQYGNVIIAVRKTYCFRRMLCKFFRKRKHTRADRPSE